MSPFRASGDHLAIDLPGARALFTTRRGGVSTGSYQSLNLGRWTDDSPQSVERNRTLLSKALGVTLAYARQVHGSSVHRVGRESDLEGEPPEADGQVTALGGVALMVVTADCLPIALATDGAVAMLHAGWRGLATGIVEEGVRAVRELGRGGSVAVAIGPGAGPCCYEVGDEVRASFATGGANGNKLDLKAIARLELERSGVDAIDDVGVCTICSGEFYSHRRERGVTGRQAGLVWLI